MTSAASFTLTNPAPVTNGGVKLQPFGMGAGMLGLPGDFTPPSRFVWAAAFATSVETGQTGDEAVLKTFHVLNNFDIPTGTVREREKGKRMSTATNSPTTPSGPAPTTWPAGAFSSAPTRTARSARST